ncbi:MAG: magnesium/cobalt transporter CorA [Treponema sp.]|jgi:magnesium transporter|nr:magnesium/cobalt transporter CorA [Treponema sp.]
MIKTPFFAKGKEIYLPPEDPVYVGDRTVVEMDLSIITYDAVSAEKKKLSNIDELTLYKDSKKILWINISGLKDIDSIKRLGQMYGIHPLNIEDILNTEQQPKIETFDEYRFLSAKTIKREKKTNDEQENRKKFSAFFSMKIEKNKEPDSYLIDQISIIIMENVLFTFQETHGDSFDAIRQRIMENIGEIRKNAIDYLAYSIIDSVVDEYSITLDHLDDVIEDFEDRATKTSDDKFIQQLQDTKKYLIKIKRAILPLKNNMLMIYHHNKFFNSDEFKPFFQDLNEHLNDAITIAENQREWLSHIMDVNLSVLSHQMNKVMKVLAIISTIFIPLTFIAGVYGMNFEFMPELGNRIAYPITLACMGLIGVTMVIIFKIHHWF